MAFCSLAEHPINRKGLAQITILMTERGQRMIAVRLLRVSNAQVTRDLYKCTCTHDNHMTRWGLKGYK